MPEGRCVRGRRAREPAQGAGVPGHRRRGAGATRSRQLCAWDRCGCPPPVPRAQEQHARRPGRAAGRGDGQGDGGGLADEATGRAAAGMPGPCLRTGRRVVGLPEGRADGSCAPGTDAAAHQRSQAHKSNAQGDGGGLADEAPGRASGPDEATGADCRMRRRARAAGRGVGRGPAAGRGRTPRCGGQGLVGVATGASRGSSSTRSTATAAPPAAAASSPKEEPLTSTRPPWASSRSSSAAWTGHSRASAK